MSSAHDSGRDAAPSANAAPRSRASAGAAPRLGPLWLVLLCLALALLLDYLVAATAPNFETLALGDQTQSVYGSYDGDKIFCGSPAELPECLAPAARRNLPRRVVWLGNSQLHAINQTRPGQVTAPVLLAQTLRPRGVEVQALSFPNGSLAEFYLAWQLERKAAKIDVLIVPLFLDDTREGQVRDVLRPVALAPDLQPKLAATPAGRAILKALPAAPEATIDNSRQARSEAAITGWLERCCGFQTMRERARGQIEINAFYLRNTVFNVTAQSVRPVLPENYALNLAAFEQLLVEARAAGTRVVAYIPPLRQDVAPPYVPAEYAAFKATTRALAARHGAILVDVDATVPGPLWGMKDAPRLGGGTELDFMHYQAAGHALLTRRLEPAIADALR